MPAAHALGMPGTFSLPPTWKPLVSDPGMHYNTCVKHVPWCMSESLTRGGGENVPDIPGACATCKFTYLARGPWFAESDGFGKWRNIPMVHPLYLGHCLRFQSRITNATYIEWLFRRPNWYLWKIYPVKYSQDWKKKSITPLSKSNRIFFSMPNDDIFQCIDTKSLRVYDEAFCIWCGKYHKSTMHRRARANIHN